MSYGDENCTCSTGTWDGCSDHPEHGTAAIPAHVMVPMGAAALALAGAINPAWGLASAVAGLGYTAVQVRRNLTAHRRTHAAAPVVAARSVPTTAVEAATEAPLPEPIFTADEWMAALSTPAGADEFQALAIPVLYSCGQVWSAAQELGLSTDPAKNQIGTNALLLRRLAEVTQ